MSSALRSSGLGAQTKPKLTAPSRVASRWRLYGAYTYQKGEYKLTGTDAAGNSVSIGTACQRIVAVSSFHVVPPIAADQHVCTNPSKQCIRACIADQLSRATTATRRRRAAPCAPGGWRSSARSRGTTPPA